MYARPRLLAIISSFPDSWAVGQFEVDAASGRQKMRDNPPLLHTDQLPDSCCGAGILPASDRLMKKPALERHLRGGLQPGILNLNNVPA